MSSRRAKCPKCGTVLQVHGDIGLAAVRCGACRTVFHLPPPEQVADETIAGWLGAGLDDEEDAAATAAPAPAPAPDSPPPPKPTSPPKSLRVVSIQRRGVLFEFPAKLLRDESFRCALPRCCAHCLARGHLSAHLIIYTPELRDSIALEREHEAGHLKIPQSELAGLHGPELLNRLPEVPNVPEPGNLPMPYWVCDMCSGAGSISGQIRVNAATGRGICRLLMRNLQMSVSFLANAGGEGTKDYAELREFLAHMQEDRWDAMPSVVRHRLEQWFRAAKGERFLAYVPDRAFVRTEDGMNGIIISTGRLVYHHPPMHQEVSAAMKLTIRVRSAQGNEVASIEAPAFKRRSITLDRGGMMLLRRSLSQARFATEWK